MDQRSLELKTRVTLIIMIINLCFTILRYNAEYT
jgi:hypothetical protein